MRSSGKYGATGFVLVALVLVAAACTTPEVSPPPNGRDVTYVPPPVIVPDPPQVDARPTVPLKDHQKVVAALAEARGRVTGLESANAKLVADNETLTENMKTLQAELAIAKAEAEQLQKKLDAIMSPRGPAEDPEPATSDVEEYTVQSGDGFETIAAKTEIYGNPERWTDLYEANRERLGLAKPEDLRAGMKLEIKRP
jgi:nucleoid-associated protein YgaU